MAIYTISDLHLSLGLNKPMNIFRRQLGKSWKKGRTKLDKKSKRKRPSTITRGLFMGYVYRRSKKGFWIPKQTTRNKASIKRKSWLLVGLTKQNEKIPARK